MLYGANIAVEKPWSTQQVMKILQNHIFFAEVQSIEACLDLPLFLTVTFRETKLLVMYVKLQRFVSHQLLLMLFMKLGF